MVSEYSTIWQNWPYHWAVIWVLICTLHLTVCFYHVTYAFQSESILNSCLNVKELLPQIRRQIWSLSGRNWTQTQKHLVRKQKLNHFDKLTKWFSCVLSICLYGAFGCMFLSSNIGVSELIHTLYLPQCQAIACSKLARYLKLKWMQLDWNTEPLSS